MNCTAKMLPYDATRRYCRLFSEATNFWANDIGVRPFIRCGVGLRRHFLIVRSSPVIIHARYRDGLGISMSVRSVLYAHTTSIWHGSKFSKTAPH